MTRLPRILSWLPGVGVRSLRTRGKEGKRKSESAVHLVCIYKRRDFPHPNACGATRALDDPTYTITIEWTMTRRFEREDAHLEAWTSPVVPLDRCGVVGGGERDRGVGVGIHRGTRGSLGSPNNHQSIEFRIPPPVFGRHHNTTHHASTHPFPCCDSQRDCRRIKRGGVDDCL